MSNKGKRLDFPKVRETIEACRGDAEWCALKPWNRYERTHAIAERITGDHSRGGFATQVADRVADDT